MPQIQPVDPALTEGKSRELLQSVQKQLGMVPNMMKTLAHSPAVLEGYLQFGARLSGGLLSSKLQEKIAVAVAGLNQCGYCASAHTAIGKKVEVEAEELLKNLLGESDDVQTSAVLSFVKTVVKKRGRLSENELERLRAVGFSDAEIIEIIAHVGINTFTNYFNNIAGTVIDFPKVELPQACAV